MCVCVCVYFRTTDIWCVSNSRHRVCFCNLRKWKFVELNSLSILYTECIGSKAYTFMYTCIFLFTYVSSHKWSRTHRVQDKYNIYHENNVPSTPGCHHYGQEYMMYSHDLHVPKCMSCHKAIVVIMRRVHCFHDYIYIC